MRKYHRPLAAATLVAAALAPAAAAQGATKTVDYGLGKPPAGMPETAMLYDFFPRSVKIKAGDKVKYRVNAFTVLYSGPKRTMPLVVVDDAQKVEGSTDAAGNPFWFNGQLGTPKLNPAFLRPVGDGTVRKGQKDVDHSALALGPSKPYALKFPKPGTYRVYDAQHPDIFNTVKVVKRGKVPGKAADKARAAKQTAKLVEQAQELADVTAPGNTILVGNDSRRVGFHQFFPPAARVKVGEPVSITAGERVNDIHNLAIGPEPYMKAITEALIAPGPSGVVINPAIVFPSQAPSAAGLAFSGTEQGGFVNTGLFDSDDATPLPASTTITFSAPGTYKYICNIHSDGVEGMSGTITVE